MGFENFKAIAINTLLGSILEIGFNDFGEHYLFWCQWSYSWFRNGIHLDICYESSFYQ